DEIDAIASIRGMHIGSQVSEQVISQLLTEMDGLEELRDVVLVAATNRPDMLDPALLRAGRFGRHVQINLPDKEALIEIFKIHLKEKPIGDDVNIDKLAEKLDGYTGADVQAINEEATLLAIREAVLLKIALLVGFPIISKKVSRFLLILFFIVLDTILLPQFLL
ncbi:unnamed protein product, partial [marine sediment metagenome]